MRNLLSPSAWRSTRRDHQTWFSIIRGLWKAASPGGAQQAVVGFTLLEAVNYLEHYGPQRRQRSDGSYEPVDPTHSWLASRPELSVGS